MSRCPKSAFTTAMIVAAFSGVAHAAQQPATIAPDKVAITAVMSQYNQALNASSTDDCLALYAEDGVFMPPHSPSAVGKAAVRRAYEQVFKTITLHVKFTIAEIVQMSPQWAFVRTNSAGSNKVNATGAMSAEGNQELFIFKKGADGQWKIERYSFSPTNPPRE
jgi:uncharacterized protein (TIGR02246 family)